MSRSVSIQPGSSPANADEHDLNFGIDPEVLLASGILRDPNDPQQASLRAKSLIEVGRFREARSILHGHTHSAPEPVRSRIVDQLAQCAMYGGGDWRSELEKALENHKLVGLNHEAALSHHRLGDMHLLAGQFVEADTHFLAADRLFSLLGDAGKTARVGASRARLKLRMGQLERALDRIDETLQRLGDREPRIRAHAKLERARIQACRGREDDAARELIQAEGVLGVSANATDRIITRLARAEALLVLGDSARAARGLRRLLAEAIGIEDVATRALVHALFGQALLDSDPTQARRHLTRAHHLFGNIAAEYQMASCELYLARVDQRLGLNPRARLKALMQRPLGEWPLLQAELAIARAEIYGREQPERARITLLKVRTFATSRGHMSLARVIDAVLVEQRLAAAPELDDLTPVDPLPHVETGSSYSVDQLTFASVAQPEPFVIDERPVRPYGEKPAATPEKPSKRTITERHDLDAYDTLAHNNAGDALQALQVLLPSPANEDDSSPAKVEVPVQSSSLVALLASSSRTRSRAEIAAAERESTRSKMTLITPPNDLS